MEIYHITHVQNLPRIIEHRGLYSDARRIELRLDNCNIGMSAIKQRRLCLEVDCHPGTNVGEYVPFYFCPRSVMLYLLHMGNHPDLTYTAGQNPIIHLVAPLMNVVEECDAKDVRWAFTATNAGAGYTHFYNDLADLGEVSWKAVNRLDFRSPEIKEGKQAEFLVFDFFPWELVSKIGVRNQAIYDTVESALEETDQRPVVKVMKDWYY